MLKQKREEVTNLAAPSGIAETKTVTQEKLLEEFRRVSDLLAKAATQLRTLGYVPEPDGTYKQTPEAHRAEVYTLDLDDYPFRDAVRAENKTHSGGPAWSTYTTKSNGRSKIWAKNSESAEAT